MLNYLDIASKKIENISEITFFSEKNENLKKLIIDLLLKGDNKDAVQEKISINYNKLVLSIQALIYLSLHFLSKKNYCYYYS